jgi:hypothetical protein
VALVSIYFSAVQTSAELDMTQRRLFGEIVLFAWASANLRPALRFICDVTGRLNADVPWGATYRHASSAQMGRTRSRMYTPAAHRGPIAVRQLAIYGSIHYSQLFQPERGAFCGFTSTGQPTCAYNGLGKSQGCDVRLRNPDSGGFTESRWVFRPAGEKISHALPDRSSPHAGHPKMLSKHLLATASASTCCLVLARASVRIIKPQPVVPCVSTHRLLSPGSTILQLCCAFITYKTAQLLV